MSKLLLTIALFLSCFVLYSQQVCELALEIDEPQNYCGDFSFDNPVVSEPSTSCNPIDGAGNLWFSFIADGANIVINATHEDNSNVYFSIIQFTTLDCDPSKFVEIACGENSLIGGGLLIEGTEYFVIFEVENNIGGSAELCIHSQHDTPPPANDKPCDAIVLELDNYCINGTTQYAELHQDSFPCGLDYIQDVWYKFELSEDLAFGVEVELNASNDADFQVALVEFTFDTCTSNYVIRRVGCELNNGFAIESSSLDRNQEYYLIVSSKNGDPTEFELCINQYIAEENTLICFPEIITVNGACQEVDLFNTIYTTDLPTCDNSNHIQYFQFDSGEELDRVEITLDSLGEESSVFLGFGYHLNNTCLNDFIWMEQFCGDINDAQLIINDLIPNREYTIAVGNNFGFTDKFEMCINGNYSNPFFNSTPCTAFELTTNQNCIGGTSAVGGTNTGAMSCDDALVQTENWYKIRAAAFNNPSILFNNFSQEENYEFKIGFFPDGCTNQFITLQEFCGADEGINNDFVFPDSIDFIYMAAIFSADTVHNFKLCVNYEDSPETCGENDFCHEAIDIGAIMENQDNCFTACSYNSTQENTNIPLISEFPSVWYTFDIDEESTVSLTFENAYDAKYYISLASSDDCNNFVVHDIKYAYINDDSFLRFQIPSSGSFYFIISSMEEGGGYLELCATKETNNICATDDKLRVASTSMGSSFAGPFQPGETISFCYDLPAFQSGDLADCQWLQGIVPSFGEGWNPVSFDSTGMPISTNIIQSIDQNVSWDWFTDINANVANENLFLSFNQRAQLDICHSSEFHCQGSSLATDDRLPAGWFAYKTENQHPESSYGDGLNCGNSHGPWQVCFQLIAGTDDDHSISIFSFADGLIANDAITNEFCLNDTPESQKYFVECVEEPIHNILEINTCNLLSTVVLSESENRYFWTTSNNPNIQNNFSGSGTTLEVELTNLTDTIQEANYFVKEYTGNGCLISTIDIIINVFPSLDIPRPSPTTVCFMDSIQISEIINLDDYILGNYAVDWNSNNLVNNSTDFWTGLEDELIHYEVQSSAGCTFQDSFLIDIENVIVSDFVQLNTICKDEILDFHEALPLTTIIEDSFVVNWDYPGLEDNPFVDTSFSASTDIPFVITGERGCTYEDVFSVYVPQIDLSSDINNKLCSTDAILLNAEISVDSVDLLYWITPNQDTLSQNNFALAANQFEMGTNVFQFQVQSIEGCSFSITDSVELFEVPFIDLFDLSDSVGICSYEEVNIVTQVKPEIYSLHWQTPLGEFDTLNITTSTEGQYIYEAGYVDEDISCIQTDTITIEVFPDVETSFLYDTLICENDTTEIFSINANLKFTWSTGSNSSVILATPGSYSVIVSNDYECIDEFEFEIDSRSLPDPLFSYDLEICEGDSTVIMPLDPQYDYAWNSGSSEPNQISFGGTHTVTVSDEIMCVDSFDFTIDVLEYPVVNLDYEIIQDTLFLSNLTEGDYDCSYVLNDNLIETAVDTFLVLEEGDYNLSLSCNNGECSDSESASFSIIIQGVKPQKISSANLFPNPSNGEFNISYEGEVLKRIEIFTIDGKLLQTRDVNQENRYSFYSSLTPGTYFLKLYLKNQLVTKKILVF